MSELSKSLCNILSLQAHRKVINLTKDFLDILEERHEHIQQLENVLISMGIDKYKEKKYDYQKDRAAVLSKANDVIREYEILLDSFEYKIKQ